MRLFNTLNLDTDPRGVATLWLDRAEKNNAFNAVMVAELMAALEQLRHRDDLRLLVLRGRGRHFSAGADLTWMLESAALSYADNLADAHRLGELMAQLYSFPVPTLAVVQGAAFGGALGLIACCDLAIGATQAQFSLSEVRIGLVPAVIGPYVVRAIGERAARRYALSAERFDGTRAQALGLLAECYPAAGLEQAMQQWVANLLLNSPQAMRATKALLCEVSGGQVSTTLRERCERCIADIRINSEGHEGLRAFLEKRPPAWQQLSDQGGASQ